MNGKGSKQRPMFVTEKEWNANYKRIFGDHGEEKVMQQYVLGFMFNKAKSRVLLIHKKHPDWQAGKWNGIGGKIESEDESPHDAMAREFEEETGLRTTWEDWKRVTVLWSDKCRVHVFWTVGEPRKAGITIDEEVDFFYVKILPIDVIPNLRWLIPMCSDRTILESFVDIK